MSYQPSLSSSFKGLHSLLISSSLYSSYFDSYGGGEKGSSSSSRMADSNEVFLFLDVQVLKLNWGSLNPSSFGSRQDCQMQTLKMEISVQDIYI
jgi:hypothetical protein